MEIDNKILLISIVVGLSFFSVFLIYIWNFTVDDAYISFRYSQHLSEGYGLVWNVGEPPVEGFSNLLWVLTITLGYFLNLNSVIFAKILSLMALFITLVLYWKISESVFKKQRGLSILGFSIGFLLLLVNPATALHSVSGLETMAYSAAILGMVYCGYEIMISENNGFNKYFLIFAIISSLLRPEGMLICIALYLFIILYIRKDKKVFISFFTSFITYLAIIVVFLLLRIHYFNDILPLPFYVKTLSEGGLWNGFNLLSQIFLYIIPFLTIILIAGILNLKKLNIKHFRPFILVSIIGIFLSSAPYIYSASLINYGQRILYPSLIILYILCGISLSLIINEIRDKGISLSVIFNEIKIRIFDIFPSNRYSLLIGALVVILLLSANMMFMTDLTNYHGYEERIEAAHIALGNSIVPFSDHNYTVASVDAGTISYFSKWKQLDIYSLNDRFIAKNGIATKDYIEMNHPELVIIGSRTGNDVNSSFTTQAPFIEFVNEKKYVKLHAIKYSENYYLIPFIDPNMKDFNEISAALKDVSINSMI